MIFCRITRELTHWEWADTYVRCKSFTRCSTRHTHQLQENMSGLIHMCDMTHSHVWHDSCVTCLTYMCDMTHSHVWYDSFTCVTWLIHMYGMTHSHIWHDSFSCVTCLIHMCDMAHSQVWHDSFTYVAWLILMCDRPYSHVWHGSFTFVTYSSPRVQSLSRMCDMPHSHVWQDSFTCVTWLIHMCNMTPSHHSLIPISQLIHAFSYKTHTRTSRVIRMLLAWRAKSIRRGYIHINMSMSLAIHLCLSTATILSYETSHLFIWDMFPHVTLAHQWVIHMTHDWFTCRYVESHSNQL